MSDSEKYETWRRLYNAEADLVYCLALFGDHIAEREKYKASGGLDAVRFYLVHKFSWLPAQVQGMSYSDMLFVLQEELDSFVLPEKALIN